ncbi:hypothetical protein D3C86_2091640 [compost metagenome]
MQQDFPEERGYGMVKMNCFLPVLMGERTEKDRSLNTPLVNLRARTEKKMPPQHLNFFLNQMMLKLFRAAIT